MPRDVSWLIHGFGRLIGGWSLLTRILRVWRGVDKLTKIINNKVLHRNWRNRRSSIVFIIIVNMWIILSRPLMMCDQWVEIRGSFLSVLPSLLIYKGKIKCASHWLLMLLYFISWFSCCTRRLSCLIVCCWILSLYCTFNTFKLNGFSKILLTA